MNRKILYAVWAALYILCAGLGFIPAPGGFLRAVLIVLAVVFFLPGVLLLYDAERAHSRKAVRVIRNLSILSLSLSLLGIVANFAAATASDTAGLFLHVVLGLVSAPMLCGQFWALGLFGWACLMVESLRFLGRHSAAG